jgi:hypothetical protein
MNRTPPSTAGRETKLRDAHSHRHPSASPPQQHARPDADGGFVEMAVKVAAFDTQDGGDPGDGVLTFVADA